MNDILDAITRALGIDPSYLAIYLTLIVAVANIVGKSIPESATGPLGIIRRVCKIIGLYVPNQITRTVSTATVAKAVVATASDSSIASAAECMPHAIETGTSAGVLAREILDTAGGMRAGRPYIPGESPEEGSEVPEEYRTDPFKAGAEARRNRDE